MLTKLAALQMEGGLHLPEELPGIAPQAQTPLGPNKQGRGDRHFSEKGKGLSIGFRATAGILQGKNGQV